MKHQLHINFTLDLRKILLVVDILVLGITAYWFSFYVPNLRLQERVASAMGRPFLQGVPAMILDVALCLILFLTVAALIRQIPFYRNASVWKRCAILSAAALELGLVEGYIYFARAILTAFGSSNFSSLPQHLPIWASLLFAAGIAAFFSMRVLLQKAHSQTSK